MDMTDNTAASVAEIGVRLLDGAYTAWLVAEGEAGSALHAWFEAGPRSHADAFRRYRAALDREEAAAADLCRLSEVVEPCCAFLVRRGAGG
jgi:hypothetical protein